jgi:pseudaminic acid cytidylyltransferase
MNIAIIPARGGSKRIPHKNIKEFFGQPMISYAISAAEKSGLFNHIVVSTDDEEIAQIANQWGAETPFLRPIELANDHSATVPVIAHAIEACKALGWDFDNVCCIYPSVPLIQINDLIDSLGLLVKSKVDYCFPITEYPSAIQRSLKLLTNGKVQPLYPAFELTRTQDLEPAYYDAGQFYWGKADAWLSNCNIYSNGLGYTIPNWRVVDIDTLDDWLRAEHIYRLIINNISRI